MGCPISWCCSFVIIIISCLNSAHFLDAQTLDITIIEHPSSLVAPLNATAVFSCTALCTPSPCELTGQWIINDMFEAPNHNRDSLTLTLMLNTSVVGNSSKIRCYFDLNVIPISGEHEDSETATLILTDNNPLLLNPLLEINTSHLTLTWSPPFLWPGHAIQYFNVSLTNKSDESVIYHRINNTFDNRVASFMETIQEEPLMCTEIVVNISAISNYSFSTLQQPLRMFSITDNILPFPSSFNLSEVIASNIHFLCDGNDNVNLELSIQLQLPKVACNDQRVNSTFVLINDCGDIVMIIGPILHDSSSTITQNLSYILDANHTYSLAVQVEYNSYVVATDTHQFDTFVDKIECMDEYSKSATTKSTDTKGFPDGLLDYLLMGGSLSLVLGTIITVITSYYCCYYRKKSREYRVEELRARIHTSMLNNPMYSSGSMPVYEQIPPRYVPQTTTTIIDEIERSTCTQPGQHANTCTCQESHQSVLEKCHIDQPKRVQNDVDPTEISEHSDHTGQSVSDTGEASTTTGGVQSGFHLTLTLDNKRDSINNSTFTDQ